MVRLPLNVVIIILGCIFSMLLNDFMARGLRNIPTPTFTALTKFFHADAEINIHSLPESWYFISSSLRWYLCSCTPTMSILCSAADAVSLGGWPILSKVRTFSVAICTVLLHLSSFCLCLNSVADFSNTGTRSPTSAERACRSWWNTTRSMKDKEIGWPTAPILQRRI